MSGDQPPHRRHRLGAADEQGGDRGAAAVEDRGEVAGALVALDEHGVSAARGAEIAQAVDKGICAFLPKPFDIGALSALVRSCVVLPC